MGCAELGAGLQEIGQTFGNLVAVFDHLNTQKQTRKLSKLIGAEVGMPDFETNDPQLAQLMATFRVGMRRADIAGMRAEHSGGGGGEKPTAAMKNASALAGALSSDSTSTANTLNQGAPWARGGKTFSGSTPEQVFGPALQQVLSGSIKDNTAATQKAVLTNQLGSNPASPDTITNALKQAQTASPKTPIQTLFSKPSTSTPRKRVFNPATGQLEDQ